MTQSPWSAADQLGRSAIRQAPTVSPQTDGHDHTPTSMRSNAFGQYEPPVAAEVIHEGRQLHLVSFVALLAFGGIAIVATHNDVVTRGAMIVLALFGLVTLYPHLRTPAWVLRFDEDGLSVQVRRRGKLVVERHARDEITHMAASRRWIPGGDGYIWVTCLDVAESDGRMYAYELPPVLSVCPEELKAVLADFPKNRAIDSHHRL